MVIYCFDLDQTLCRTSGLEYDKAEPITSRIKHVNQLHDAGHTILVFTARGTKTGINYRDLTRMQLERWGLKFHELILGKPAADIYVDDRGIGDDEFFKDG